MSAWNGLVPSQHSTGGKSRLGTITKRGEKKGEKGEAKAGSFDGYAPLVVEIVKFFQTKQPPVSAEETIELFTFMEAADESKRQGGKEVKLADVLAKARASDLAAAKHLALRIQNLHVADWSVWAKGKDPSTAERLRPTTRGVVLDIGSIPSVAERAAVAAVVLGNLWRNREQRQPRLIVIDEDVTEVSAGGLVTVMPLLLGG